MIRFEYAFVPVILELMEEMEVVLTSEGIEGVDYTFCTVVIDTKKEETRIIAEIPEETFVKILTVTRAF